MSDNEIKREQPSFEVKAESLKERTKEFFSTYENPNGSEDRLEICLIREGYRAVLMAEEEIHRQNAEIESKNDTIHILSDALSEQKDSIEALIAGQETLQKLAAEMLKDLAEAVKMEFYREFDELIPSVMAEKIDELVKERVGEG